MKCAKKESAESDGKRLSGAEGKNRNNAEAESVVCIQGRFTKLQIFIPNTLKLSRKFFASRTKERESVGIK
jgi:hypothetical protein